MMNAMMLKLTGLDLEDQLEVVKFHIVLKIVSRTSFLWQETHLLEFPKATKPQE